MAYKAAQELTKAYSEGSDSIFSSVSTAMARVMRISKGQEISGNVDPDRFEQNEETELWNAYQIARSKVFIFICL